jgi:hypothetical protein
MKMPIAADMDFKAYVRGGIAFRLTLERSNGAMAGRQLGVHPAVLQIEKCRQAAALGQAAGQLAAGLP